MLRSVNRCSSLLARWSSAQLRGGPLGASGPADTTNPWRIQAGLDRSMRFRRAPSGALVLASAASAFQSTMKGQEVACGNRHTTPSHLRPTPAHKMASVLSQMLLLDVYSFFNRSIFVQVKPQPLAPCRVHPNIGRWMPTRGGLVRSLLPQAANNWGKGHHTGSAVGATRFGRPPADRWPGPDAVDLRPGSTSEIATVERFWWEGVIVEDSAKQTSLPNASAARHLTSATDSHPITERFHIVLRQAFLQSSHSLSATLICKANKDLVSVSSFPRVSRG